MLAAEEARWARFHRPCQVVQVEVGGIAAVADRLGQAPAERLLGMLADTLLEETRQSDLYARASTWRIQGVLPEQEPAGGVRYEERVRDGFRRRLGPEIPIGLLFGIADPESAGSISDAIDAAERSMGPEDRAGIRPSSEDARVRVPVPPSPPSPVRPSLPSEPGEPLETVPRAVSPAPAPAGPPSRMPGPEPAPPASARERAGTRVADVRDALLELERLRDDRLVADDEYRRKRDEILARL